MPGVAAANEAVPATAVYGFECSATVEPESGVVIVTGAEPAFASPAPAATAAAVATTASFVRDRRVTGAHLETTQPLPVASNASLLHSG